MGAESLRLIVYDDTCRPRARPFGLSTAWSAGSVLYRALARTDASRGVRSWSEALDWLARVEPSRAIAEVQFWGHGKWGTAMVDEERLDVGVLSPRHPLHVKLAAVRERLVGDAHALVWFRTCETLGACAGQDFAVRLADWLGARVAGHTFVIGAVQSGLCGVAPGARPTWSVAEGLAAGTPDAPRAALGSSWRAPRTISCLQSAVPEAWMSSRPSGPDA